MQKTDPIEMLDQMYPIVYWMTRSLKKTKDLVYKTYDRIDSDTSEIELFKTFREVYNEDLELESPLQTTSPDGISASLPSQENVDIKLSTLLVELCDFSYQEISTIMDQPVETIRQWLATGRTLLLKEYFRVDSND
ncbi:MAG: RNA polymerase subunit sigma-24 [Chlorobiaceae bacterium]|nr:RNA polymerase subunit sigma-24 [Chlorobiaceae bacterium]